jgi:SAM-dependent methyltransferase
MDKKYGDLSYLNSGQMRWSHEIIMKNLKNTDRRVLEIGCFNGFFVKAMRGFAIDAYGFDLNSKAIAKGRSNYDIQNILFDNLESAYGQGPFDDIIMVDVLEHIDDADGFLKEAIRHLGANGRIVVAGPIADRYFLDKTDFPPHHLWRFSRKGLRLLAEKNGLTPDTWDVQYDFSLFLRNALGRIVNGFSKREYYGEGPSVTDDRVPRVVLLTVDTIRAITTPILTRLDLPYCSAVVVMEKP